MNEEEIKKLLEKVRDLEYRRMKSLVLSVKERKYLEDLLASQ